jgi:methylmalonyl-CoA mutase cobalamin-binding domain/chain
LKYQRDEIVCESRTVCDRYDRKLSVPELGVSDKYEIGVVTGGVGICRVINEAMECKEGDMFVIGRGIPHGFFASEGGSELNLLWVSFPESAFCEGGLADEHDSNFSRFFNGGITYSCSVLNSSALKDIREICSLLRREQTDKSLDWKVASKAYLILLLITVERYIDLADTVKHEDSKEWSPAFFAVNEVMRCFSDPNLTLGTVAERLYVSPSRLSRDFAKVMGESFSDYLRRIRMREACAYLENSDMTNEEIAFHCGLRDLAGFYAAFKKHVGVTPHIYRKNKETEKLFGDLQKRTVSCSDISECIQRGRFKDIRRLVDTAINNGVEIERILNDGLIHGMVAVGERFKNNEAYVPEVLVAARVMNEALEVLNPLMKNEMLEPCGRVCIGTVRGDLHDIGKNLVKMMMEGRGIEVIDLGTDVSPEEFVNTAIEKNCGIICCSALLTTTMNVMEEVVKAAERAGVRDRIKIMIGGAPVNEEFCQMIGADCYTPDAVSAAEAAIAIFEQNK